ILLLPLQVLHLNNQLQMLIYQYLHHILLHFLSTFFHLNILLQILAECQLYADYVKKSLAQTRHFRAEFADYAVDSVFFALGLTDYVPEPSDHGFDPAAEDW
ncbi:MAG: hypothetical protein SPL25_12900, partial [Succinivibrionaceae bacterium]|nr:hypothetical protein [Succinivibrionaceae bacterium]